MGVQSLSYTQILGENFQSREVLSALVFTLVVTKIVQVLITSWKAKKSKVLPGGDKQETESYEAYHSLPGPRALPLIGNIFQLIKDNGKKILTCIHHRSIFYITKIINY